MPVYANGAPAPPPPGPGVIASPVQLPAPQNNLLAAQAILTSLYTARQNNPTGLNTVTVDGQTVQYANPAALDQAIQLWERKVARLAGRRPVVFQAQLGF